MRTLAIRSRRRRPRDPGAAMTHRIQLHASGRDLYRVSGAVDLHDTGTPILDAAKMLIESGASPSDTLHVVSADATFSDMPLGSILRPRRAPPKFDRALEVWTSR